MPIKLIPPRKGKTPYWYGKGSYLGVAVDRSTKAVRKSIAAKVVAKWEREIESDTFAVKGEPTFLSAAVSYANAGGERRRGISRLNAHFGERLLREITQDVIDAAAHELFPNATAATRNREVYTPVSAILKHAGVKFELRRPKGSRGRVMLGWLSTDEAERLIAAADAQDAEFGLLCRILLYTGLRLSEAVRHFAIDRLDLSQSLAFIPKTKNGNPRAVHLPPHLVADLANHPRGLARPGETVFRFHKGGRLYDLLRDAAKDANVALPERQAFHIFRHTYATWLFRFAGMNSRGLVGTGAWDSEQSVNRYVHTVQSEEARRSDLLPVVAKSVETKAKAS